MIDYFGNEIAWVPKWDRQAHTSSNMPIYVSIAISIERDILEGHLKSGFKLPAQRIIASYLGINHSTVTRAYKLCEEKGLIKGIVGKGTFVSSTAGIPTDLLTSHEDNRIIEMGMTLPLYEVNSLIEERIGELYPSIDYRIALKYAPPEGHVKHRYIASTWLKQYHIQSTPENIIVTSGTQNALSIILISLFTKGDRIIVDELTYTGLKSLAKLLGIILVPVRGDGSGIDIEELDKASKRERAKGIYLIPDSHNPTSITLSQEKRHRISEVILKYNLLLIEDGTFRFSVRENTQPISSIIPGQSIYIHGTSKAINPTFRISYIVAPDNYVKPLRHAINNLTWMASPLTAEIVSLFQATATYEEIVKAKLNILEERNRLFDESFHGYEFYPSRTALYRYLVLPNAWSDSHIEREFLEAGVQVFSSKRFSIGISTNHCAIRICVSAPKNLEELREGIHRIKDVLQSDQLKFEPII